jgi:hypothetical protein
LGVVIGLSVILLARPSQPLSAQETVTATPDAEGIIYEIVQPNDTLWAIAVRSGLTLEELLSLNEMSATDLILPGDKLIIGYGATPLPPTPDATATPTATLPPPSPRPPTSTPPPTAVCLSAFQDSNLNGRPDPDEPLQAAVAFTIYTQAAVAANYVTDGLSEPYCVPLLPDSYQITRSLAAGESLTSSGNQAIILNEGDVIYLAFGSVMGEALPVQTSLPLLTPVGVDATAVTAPSPTPPATGGQPASAISLIPLLAVIIGGLLLTIAAIYFVRTRINRNP